MSWLFKGEEAQSELPPSAQVERLVTRLSSATMLDDRRTAVNELRARSKTYKVEVGSQALSHLVDVLKNDRGDPEIINATLETLVNITARANPTGPPTPDDVGVMFTEIFVKNTDDVILLLSLLEETEYSTRLLTIQLLTTLLNNCSRLLQDAITLEGSAVAKLMDLLGDSRDVIRNEALLLMIGLVKDNVVVQKIVAFQNGFDLVMNIMSAEMFSHGGVITADCIRLLKSMTDGNTSNQASFREASFFSALIPFFSDEDKTAWPSQRVENVRSMLEFVRIFVRPDSAKTVRTQNQNAIGSSGLLTVLYTTAFEPTFPAMSETLVAIGEIIAGNTRWQDTLAAATTTQGFPTTIACLNVAFDKNPFPAQHAAVFLLQQILVDNQPQQLALVESLLPSQTPAVPSPGLLLCQGLLAQQQPILNWMAALCLSHVLLDNTTAKEKLLSVALTQVAGSPPTSLLAICVSQLAVAKHLKLRCGLLCLLATWLHDCAFAVKSFLQIPDIISFLVRLIHDHDVVSSPVLDGLVLILFGVCITGNDNTLEGHTKSDLLEIVAHRIGNDEFTQRLSRFAQGDVMASALKAGYVSTPLESTWFGFEIATKLRAAATDITNVFGANGETSPDMNHSTVAGVQYHDEVVSEYQSLIREQDQKLQAANAEKQQLEQQLLEAQQRMSQLEVEAQAATIEQSPTADSTQGQQIAELTAQLQGLQQYYGQFAQQAAAFFSQALSVVDPAKAPQGEFTQIASAFSSSLQQLQLLPESFKLPTFEPQAPPTPDSPTTSSGDQIDELQLELRAARGDVIELQEQVEAKEIEIERAVKAAEDASAEATRLASEVEVSKDRAKATQEELEELNLQHSDLLVLLADMDEKVQDYRERIIQLGGEVSEDELDDTVADGDGEEEQDDE
eukprot:m.28682 g.28682  ORF g.28682 m.28682 type:complete len:904 (-) comp9063_c0_seq2:146-2857(-)